MKVTEKSTNNMQKVQLSGTVLEDKGAQFVCRWSCEQQNSLEQRINFIENLVVKGTTSTSLSYSKRKRRIMGKQNFSKDDMISANELTKSNSDSGLNIMQQERMKFNLGLIPMNDRAIHWFLIIVDLQSRCVALLNSLPLNKSNDFKQELAKDLVRITHVSYLVLTKCSEQL
ncbi:hypothetical protein Cgig2_021705 [Carnegiea gigantea]|uniref:Ubiquitin-like protease family profile domain-containing protein n=1 Tax=Carnegiea gigantea TaxID=171969 RepID=A0A9Q1KUV1_9CARY|nr:hypothetical protein Cgig2_021705 [Carnegiea gigantea]